MGFICYIVLEASLAKKHGLLASAAPKEKPYKVAFPGPVYNLHFFIAGSTKRSIYANVIILLVSINDANYAVFVSVHMNGILIWYQSRL